jgi:hypothetical protein
LLRRVVLLALWAERENSDMRLALLTLGVGLVLTAVVVLSDPLGVLVLFPLIMLVLVFAVAVYAIGKAVDSDD